MGLKENQELAAKFTILQYFKYAHLPADLQVVSSPFCKLAWEMARMLPDNPEKSVALRKLLEAKDAAVRAAIAEQNPDWVPPSSVQIENTCKPCDEDHHSACRTRDCACRKRNNIQHPALSEESPAHPFVEGYPKPSE